MLSSVNKLEEKKRLLDWLKSHPSHDKLTIENYVCLAGILSKAGWKHDGTHWVKITTLPIIEAACVELTDQIERDLDAHLCRTVSTYQSKFRKDG